MSLEKAQNYFSLLCSPSSSPPPSPPSSSTLPRLRLHPTRRPIGLPAIQSGQRRDEALRLARRKDVLWWFCSFRFRRRVAAARESARTARVVANQLGGKWSKARRRKKAKEAGPGDKRAERARLRRRSVARRLSSQIGRKGSDPAIKIPIDLKGKRRRRRRREEDARGKERRRTITLGEQRWQ